MSSTSLAHDAHLSTDPAIKGRVRRGLKLFRERGEAIEPLGRGKYSVPSCTTEERYEVDLGIISGEQRCSCPDFVHAGVGTCKHLIGAELYRSKVQRPRWLEKVESARRRHGERDLVHVGDVALRVLAGAVGAGL